MGKLNLRLYILASTLILSACKGFEPVGSAESSNLDLLKGGITVNAGADQLHQNVNSTGKVVSMAGSVDVKSGKAEIVSYKWASENAVLAQGISASVLNASFLLLPGQHQLTLSVTDTRGFVTSDSLIVELRQAVAIVTPTPTIAPTIVPLPTTSPSPTPSQFPKVGDFDVIPSNFDINDWLNPTAIPGTAAPDVVGAFRFDCHVSHERYDDPIVYPGQPGASHLHSFFGNTAADAMSTYESLRKFGDGTCSGGPANRSAYWFPSMMNGKGKVIRPDHITVYYKQAPQNSDQCLKSSSIKGCAKIPRGLRMVFGNTMDGAHPTNAKESLPYFHCVGNGFKSYNLVELAANCPMSATNVRLAMVIHAAACWDGISLDSADHRSHVVYSRRDPNTGIKSCPITHQWALPGFTILASFNLDADLYNDLKADGTWAGTYNGWHLSSDKMNNLIPGRSVHADWFGAWDDTILQTWQENCIDKLLSCSSGNLGNGTILKRPTHSSTLATAPLYVDPPPMPANHTGH